MKVDVRDPSCAVIAMVCMLHWLKIARSGRRRRFNVSALRNAYISFPEARHLVEAKMPTVISGRPTLLLIPPEESPNLLNVRHL